MDDGEPLKTLLDLAQQPGASTARTGRRALEQAMANDPGLRVTMRGRTVLFTPEQFNRTIKALEWRSPSYSAGQYRTRTVRSVGDRSAQSTLDAIRELTRKAPRSGPKRS